jgi:hypothetical protein
MEVSGMELIVPFRQSATRTNIATATPLRTRMLLMDAHANVRMDGPAMTARQHQWHALTWLIAATMAQPMI